MKKSFKNNPYIQMYTELLTTIQKIGKEVEEIKAKIK